jgi:hypothetical protein
MQGTILGDLVASRFAEGAVPGGNFDLFTVDCRLTPITILTVAVAAAMLDGEEYTASIEDYVNRYLDGTFPDTPPAAYVAPVAWLCNSLEQSKREARRVAAAIEERPEFSREAEQTAGTIFLARQPGAEKELLRRHDETPNPTHSPAFTAFLDSTGLLSAIRLAVQTGDEVTVRAAIAGGIAEAYYGPPPAPVEEVMRAFMPNEFQDVLYRFRAAQQVG